MLKNILCWCMISFILIYCLFYGINMVFPGQCSMYAWEEHIFCYYYIFFVFWWGAPTAYGISQFRGHIRAGLLAYTITTATWDLSHICDLCHCSWQCQILSPLCEARDWTHSPMDTSRVRYHWAMMRTPVFCNCWLRYSIDVLLIGLLSVYIVQVFCFLFEFLPRCSIYY